MAERRVGEGEIKRESEREGEGEREGEREGTVRERDVGAYESR